MRLLLINPRNPLALAEIRQRWFNRFRVWKPLGLLTVAALTPPPWEIRIIDENLGVPDYAALPRPDLVGITAFTSQACRAYDLAKEFHAAGVPVIMGGIHASMCPDEASQYVDSIVIGEAEGVWKKVLSDFETRCLEPRYTADTTDVMLIPPARHDLLPRGYGFGAVQTTRGCPLNCSFCSVTAFNGAKYRYRPIADVVDEMKQIPERHVLIVDDNLIGISSSHLARAKDLFRAILDANLNKKWIAQVTVNMGDDDELLALAARSGCVGVFIGFESPTQEGLAEVGKKFNLVKGRDLRAAVARIRRHGILVCGSFIVGLDSDGVGSGKLIASAARHYGLDLLNALFLTPLPGTRLWEQMQREGRIVADDYPYDWRYYTLTFPVADYKQLTPAEVIREMASCDRAFYSPWHILRRVGSSLLRLRHPLISLIGNLSYRGSMRSNHRAYADFLCRPPATLRLGPAMAAQSPPPATDAGLQERLVPAGVEEAETIPKSNRCVVIQTHQVTVEQPLPVEHL